MWNQLQWQGKTWLLFCACSINLYPGLSFHVAGYMQKQAENWRARRFFWFYSPLLSHESSQGGIVRPRPVARNKTLARVLFRIYRLGEKPRVAKGHELPSGIRGHAPRKCFEINMCWDEICCILRRFWEMLQWYFILFFSRDHVSCHIVSLDREYLLHVHWPRRVWMIFSDSYLYTVMVIIYLGGGGSWAILFWGGAYPSNTLDRTLLAVPEALKTQMTRWSNILTNKPQNILSTKIPVCRNQKELSLEEGCL